MVVAFVAHRITVLDDYEELEKKPTSTIGNTQHKCRLHKMVVAWQFLGTHTNTN
jgi:hypothetical protein